MVGVEVLTGRAALFTGRTGITPIVLRTVRMWQQIVGGVTGTANVRTTGGLHQRERSSDRYQGDQEQSSRRRLGFHVDTVGLGD